MEHAPLSAAALRDRAERHVFAELPELDAVDRRVLALLELAQGDRELAARETGLDDEAVRHAAARARKALRRTRAPLAAGGRCEHAELLLSDAIDGALHWRDRRWLDIHLDRCPRCREHEQLLESARTELRGEFVVEEPPAPEPPAPRDDRARLRVVPPASELEPEPETALPTLTERGPPDLARTAQVIAIVMAVAALLAAIALGLSHLL